MTPFNLIMDIVFKTHTQLGHIGTSKLHNTVLGQFWHPALEKVCRDVCSCCTHCQLNKVHRLHIQPPTLKVQTKYPFQLLAVDVMLLPKSKKGNIAVLVAIDHYSKWLTAVPMKNKTGLTVSNALQNNILPNLPTIPTKILSDNGAEFISHEFNNLLKRFDITHTYSTPYKPSSNGAVERSNRTIIQLLKGVLEDSNSEWDVELPKALITYNNTVHSQTQSSPSNIILSKTHECDKKIPINYDTVKTWKVGNPKFSPFQVGQKVLRKIERVGNKVSDKLAPRYEGPFQITKIHSNNVTYLIQRVDQPESKIINTHYMKLRLFNEIPQYLKSHMDDVVPAREDSHGANHHDESSDDMPFLGFYSGGGSNYSSESNKNQDSDDSSGQKSLSSSKSYESENRSCSNKSESNKDSDELELTGGSGGYESNDGKRDTRDNKIDNEMCEKDNLSDKKIKEQFMAIMKFGSNEVSEARKARFSVLPNIPEENLEIVVADIHAPFENHSHNEINGNNRVISNNRLLKDASLNRELRLEQLSCSEPVITNDRIVLTSTPYTKISKDVENFVTSDIKNTSNIKEPSIRSLSGEVLMHRKPSSNDSQGLFLSNDEVNDIVTFLENSSEAWSKSSDVLEEQVKKFELIKYNSEEELFEGFGSVDSSKNIGSAKQNFLKALLRQSYESRELASGFLQRKIWLNNIMSSESRVRYSGIYTDSSPEAIEPINFDSSTPKRVTRSQGKPMDLPNVQPRTLEYK